MYYANVLCTRDSKNNGPSSWSAAILPLIPQVKTHGFYDGDRNSWGAKQGWTRWRPGKGESGGVIDDAKSGDQVRVKISMNSSMFSTNMYYPSNHERGTQFGPIVAVGWTDLWETLKQRSSAMCSAVKYGGVFLIESWRVG